MASIWQWVKEKAGFIYAVIFSVIGVFNILQGEWVFAILDFALGALLAWYYQHPEAPGYDRPWKRPKTSQITRYIPSGDAVPALLSKGVEPVPIPGEEKIGTHRLGTSLDCRICRALMKER